ncbi:MAG: hypothetical protein JJT76_12050 [Clostridiaceae bacterium]|nr:hypothetical protein [Clostridiaceae bacterium]
MTTKFLNEDNYIHATKEITSWGAHWEARTKVITCFVTAFGLIALNTSWLLFLSFNLLLLTVLTMGFSFKFIVSKLALLLPFLTLMSIPLVFGGGFPPTFERYQFALLLILKALSVSLIMMIMILSQPLQQLLSALSHMHLPPFVVSIFFLSYRYTFLLWENLKKIQRALLSRLFRSSLHKNSFKTYGEVVGGMLIKSIDRSEKVHRAMISRGFTGRIPASNPQPMTKLDLIKASSFIGMIIVLHIIEKW